VRFLGVCAIVGHEDDQGVLVLSLAFQQADHPSDVVIEVFDHGRIELHLPGLIGAVFRRQTVPVRKQAASRVGGERLIDQALILHPLHRWVRLAS
jgi:hypothetical protein